MLYQGNYCREGASQGRIQNSGGEGGEGQDLKHITQYLLESDEPFYYYLKPPIILLERPCY